MKRTIATATATLALASCGVVHAQVHAPYFDPLAKQAPQSVAAQKLARVAETKSDDARYGTGRVQRLKNDSYLVSVWVSWPSRDGKLRCSYGAYVKPRIVVRGSRIVRATAFTHANISCKER
jgi:hypothetical protein